MVWKLTSRLKSIDRKVLMDIRIPVMNGVETTRLIKQDFPETAVLVLTTFDDDESILCHYMVLGIFLRI